MCWSPTGGLHCARMHTSPTSDGSSLLSSSPSPLPISREALLVLFYVLHQRTEDIMSGPVRCVTHLAHLFSELRYTFSTPRQCFALYIWYTSSVSCVTHLVHLISELRYTFGTPRQCVALRIWHTSSEL